MGTAALRLDDLLAELRVRLEAVLATRDRVHALLEAVVAVGGELDLESVLRKIVSTAVTLVDARYGALGVIGDGGRLVQFVPVGLSEEEIAEIEHWPHGEGLLGLLIKEPQTLRLADIGEHPASHGFPEGHPGMSGFLGVPIRVRDEVFGNLYMTEKVGGREFDEDDEIVLTSLAAAAGVAIENARLYAESQRRETWLRASSEVTTRLLLGDRATDVLRLVVERAREMGEASVAAIALPTADGEDLAIEVADGDGEAALREVVAPMGTSLLGEVFVGGRSLRISSLTDVLPAAETARAAEGGLDGPIDGPFLAVPMGAVGETARGVLVAGRHRGQPPFTIGAERTLTAFAAQAAVAFEVADTRAGAERLAILEDHDRIARDLHDVVVQRLFATAMSLTSTLPLIKHPEAVARVRTLVNDLDATIVDIRNTIFALQPPSVRTDTSLRRREPGGWPAGGTYAADAGQEEAGVTVTIDPRRFDAVLFDLDGVITDTASVHAAAWKRLFDGYLAERPQTAGEDHALFTDEDYRRYVDGRSRGDGVTTFLESRGIHLPQGEPADSADAETVCGLGNRKNAYFRALLDRTGVTVFDSTVAFVRRLQRAGVGTAVFSASRNCGAVLEAAGLGDLFPVRVDGVVAAELGLPGKPDPAMLLEAARRLGAGPQRCVVVEDAEAGVQAGQRGGFALVVGVDRDRNADRLLAHGADAVVADLSELGIGGHGTAGPSSRTPDAPER